MTDTPRLIERAFPLKQTSLDSVHEKNVRHGHISTLHIWPARRPLAACRAALIATLLPDPGTPEERRLLCEKIGGRVVEKVERKLMPNGQVVERVREETEGGILHWKRETENAEDLEWFRQEIRKAYGGRAPKVLDPFAGGGAIPLEAMRLGCEATAVDINPVAWFILKCTLEYPQKLAGKTHPLPEFIFEDEEYMEAFYKANPHLVGRTKKTKSQKMKEEVEPGLFDRGDSDRIPKADLAWHVRAWGRWVLNRARRELAEYYPVYADFEPLDLKQTKKYEPQTMRLAPFKEDGTPDIDKLNADFSTDYLRDKGNPRWVAKPTVAYLWARTVICKNCRATVPLLKTRWLCKKAKKRVLLTMKPNADQTGVEFDIQNDVPVQGGNSAQKREHDKRLGEGTMSRAGAKCPCCGTIMTMEDIRIEGQVGQHRTLSTAVVISGQSSKEYRVETKVEHDIADAARNYINWIYRDVPFNFPNEPTPDGGGHGAGRAFSIKSYGVKRWSDLFTQRQLMAIGVFLVKSRAAHDFIMNSGYSSIWHEALCAYLSAMLDRLANQNSSGTMWNTTGEKIEQTFARFALPLHWDFPESNALSAVTGGYASAIEWLGRVCEHLTNASINALEPKTMQQSAIKLSLQGYDVVFTDPPYYDAIPYSDLMDFFYVWLRRSLSGVSCDYDGAFSTELGPKWDHDAFDGELIDDDLRHNKNSGLSKAVYEDGMARCFGASLNALNENGRLVIVFAHKQPSAWETLVSALIRAGFVVIGSWPIVTEKKGGVRNFGRASLSSSVWLVCKKRPISARPGWDNQVLEEMRTNITERLHEYWDAGIRGPDFVWAATGPALEAYSKHPVVKKANSPGEIMSVGEFLSHVRRMVVDFVVGRVLTGAEEGADLAAADRMDAPTAYYLLHRHDFGMDEAPSGACILYATACGLSDRELEVNWDILTHTGGTTPSDEDDEETDPEAEEDGGGSDTGNKVKLKAWTQRKSNSLGYEAPSGRPIPLIDRIHCLMHLWKAGDVHKVDEYLDDNGLRRHELFKRLLQSLIELSQSGGNERSLLESLSNHIGAKGAVRDTRQVVMSYGENA
jgi:adenine-specific DNA methylase